MQRYDPSHVPSVFTSADLDEMGSETIPAIPFDTSPLAIPDVLRRQSTIQSLPFTVSTEGLEWQKVRCSDLLKPVAAALNLRATSVNDSSKQRPSTYHSISPTSSTKIESSRWRWQPRTRACVGCSSVTVEHARADARLL